jgi:hypothetical protein
VLGPLVDLANELGVAFVGIMHFNKRTDVTVSPFFGRPRGDFWEWGCILRASCSGSCTVLRPVGPEVPGRPPSPGGQKSSPLARSICPREFVSEIKRVSQPRMHTRARRMGCKTADRSPYTQCLSNIAGSESGHRAG